MTWQVKVDVTCAGEPHVSASFSRSPITLGTDTSSDIVLQAPHVSRRHAEVVVSRGVLVLRDTSRNGCFVGGRRVGAELALGQRSTIGVPPFQIELVYEEEDPSWQTAYRSINSLVPPMAVDAPLPPPPPDPNAAPDAPAASAAEPAPPAASDPEPVSDEEPVDERPVDVGPAPESRPTPTAPLPIRPRPKRTDRPTQPMYTKRSKLEVVDGPEPLLGRTFELPANRMLVLGRGNDASIVLPHRSVSRRHAEMIMRPGALSIRDLSSANGVWIDGERITTARVEEGQHLTFGQVVVALQPCDPRTAEVQLSLETGAQPIGDHEDRLVLLLKGHATGAHRGTLTRALSVVDDGTIRGLVIDLSSVVTMGASVITVLGEVATSLEARNGCLVLSGAGRQVSQALAQHEAGERLREHMAIDVAGAIDQLDALL